MTQRKPKDFILRSYRASLVSFEREYLLLLMSKAENSPIRMARISGLGRSTIWRMMKRNKLRFVRAIEDVR